MNDSFNFKELTEEVLEELWLAQEEETLIDPEFNFIKDKITPELTQKIKNFMLQEGLIELKPDKILATSKGLEKGRDIIRRHRLAERLLHEIFDLNKTEMEKEACIFEHILSETVTERICTFLGHPASCPHGKKIPQGKCCQTRETNIKPMVRRLSDFDVGEKGVVSLIVSKDHNRVSQLAALGLQPDAIINLHQKRPALILEINDTTLSIDKEIAREIYLKEL